ncbi:unnamed protein product [Chrysoparadoxa australica]
MSEIDEGTQIEEEDDVEETQLDGEDEGHTCQAEYKPGECSMTALDNTGAVSLAADCTQCENDVTLSDCADVNEQAVEGTTVREDATAAAVAVTDTTIKCADNDSVTLDDETETEEMTDRGVKDPRGEAAAQQQVTVMQHTMLHEEMGEEGGATQLAEEVEGELETGRGAEVLMEEKTEEACQGVTCGGASQQPGPDCEAEPELAAQLQQQVEEAGGSPGRKREDAGSQADAMGAVTIHALCNAEEGEEDREEEEGLGEGSNASSGNETSETEADSSDSGDDQDQEQEKQQQNKGRRVVARAATTPAYAKRPSPRTIGFHAADTPAPSSIHGHSQPVLSLSDFLTTPQCKAVDDAVGTPAQSTRKQDATPSLAQSSVLRSTKRGITHPSPGLQFMPATGSGDLLVRSGKGRGSMRRGTHAQGHGIAARPGAKKLKGKDEPPGDEDDASDASSPSLSPKPVRTVVSTTSGWLGKKSKSPPKGVQRGNINETGSSLRSDAGEQRRRRHREASSERPSLLSVELLLTGESCSQMRESSQELDIRGIPRSSQLGTQEIILGEQRLREAKANLEGKLAEVKQKEVEAAKLNQQADEKERNRLETELRETKRQLAQAEEEREEARAALQARNAANAAESSRPSHKATATATAGAEAEAQAEETMISQSLLESKSAHQSEVAHKATPSDIFYGEGTDESRPKAKPKSKSKAVVHVKRSRVGRGKGRKGRGAPTSIMPPSEACGRSSKPSPEAAEAAEAQGHEEGVRGLSVFDYTSATEEAASPVKVRGVRPPASTSKSKATAAAPRTVARVGPGNLRAKANRVSPPKKPWPVQRPASGAVLSEKAGRGVEKAGNEKATCAARGNASVSPPQKAPAPVRSSQRKHARGVSEPPDQQQQQQGSRQPGGITTMKRKRGRDAALASASPAQAEGPASVRSSGRKRGKKMLAAAANAAGTPELSGSSACGRREGRSKAKAKAASGTEGAVSFKEFWPWLAGKGWVAKKVAGKMQYRLPGITRSGGTLGVDFLENEAQVLDYAKKSHLIQELQKETAESSPGGAGRGSKRDSRGISRGQAIAAAGADVREVDWSSAWKVLQEEGWRCRKGAGLIDYYYLAPGVSPKTGVPGETLFTSEADVLEYYMQRRLAELPQGENTSAGPASSRRKQTTPPNRKAQARKKAKGSSSGTRNGTGTDTGNGKARVEPKARLAPSRTRPRRAATMAPPSPAEFEPGGGASESEEEFGEETQPQLELATALEMVALQNKPDGVPVPVEEDNARVRGATRCLRCAWALEYPQLFISNLMSICSASFCFPHGAIAGLSGPFTAHASAQNFPEPIEKGGGKVLPLMQDKRLGEKSAVTVIARLGSYNTTKYLWALVGQIPIVHYLWVTKSIERGSCLPLGDFTLPAGESTVSGCELVMQPASGHEEERESPLQGVKLMVLHSEEKQQGDWTALLAFAGAEVHTERPKPLAELDYVLYDPHDDKLACIDLPGLVNRRVKAMRAIIKQAAGNKGVRLATFDWARQCLLHMKCLKLSDSQEFQPQMATAAASARNEMLKLKLNRETFHSGNAVSYEVCRGAIRKGKILDFKAPKKGADNDEVKVRLVELLPVLGASHALQEGSIVLIKASQLRDKLLVLDPKQFEKIRENYGEADENVFHWSPS